MVEKPFEPDTSSNKAADHSIESTTERVAQSAHAVTDEASTKTQVVEEESRDRVERAREVLKQTQAVACEQAERYLRLLENYISLLLLWRGKASSMQAETSMSEKRDDSSAVPWNLTREPGCSAIGHRETSGTCKLSCQSENKGEQ